VYVCLFLDRHPFFSNRCCFWLRGGVLELHGAAIFWTPIEASWSQNRVGPYQINFASVCDRPVLRNFQYRNFRSH
jgi:hypothetical protein